MTNAVGPGGQAMAGHRRSPAPPKAETEPQATFASQNVRKSVDRGETRGYKQQIIASG